MSKFKLFISLAVIVMAVALVGGATMAWFTSATDPIENVFTAGTVEIEADYQSDFGKLITENWNPGDCDKTEICVINEGSKAVQLRAKFEGGWVPGSQKMLVLYHDKGVQLLSLDWDSFCKGCTGREGHIAEGDMLISNPGSFSYFDGMFSDPFDFIKNDDWLQAGINYMVWCVDSQTTIAQGTHKFKVFDPNCNENWYDEVDTQSPKWDNIPWYKLNFIINNYSAGVDGYSVDDIQDAMWSFTNPGSTKYHYMFLNTDTEISEKAKEIVDDVLANSGLPDGTVDVNINTTGWTDGEDGWWYYDNEIPGTFTESDEGPRKICLEMEVCLDGATTGNLYQGATYHLYTRFQAIQASHDSESGSDVTWNWSDFDDYN